MAAEEIFAAVASGAAIEDMAGDFVAYSDDEIVSSTVSALPWYYHVSADGTLFQGSNVFDIAVRARIPWRWNRRALTSLALFHHTLGADTLCDGIFRAPPASRLKRGDDGQLRWSQLGRRPPAWDTVSEIEPAATALLSAFDDCVRGEEDVLISLSAGFDSRLLLACALHQGLTPRLGVMGYAQTADRIVATQIAADLRLPIQVVELVPDDYLRRAQEISYQTSGVKAAAHWHTYLYADQVGAHQAVHLIGCNGEFARSYYLDNAKLNWLADHLPPSVSDLYFDVRLARRRLKFSRHNLLARGAFDWRRDGPMTIAKSGAHPKTFADALDAFYAWQRVRHFIGGGLACYATSGRPRSPFLDGRWVSACAATKRHWKRGNAFHRHCTQTFLPALASYPHEGASAGPTRSYSPFDDLCRSKTVDDLIMDSAALDMWFSRDQRRHILNDEHAYQAEERGFLLTLLYARENVLAAGLEEPRE